MPLAGGLVAGVIAFVLGFLLAGYRGIFFAMLSLAFSMILYGLLIKIVAARQQRRFQHRVASVVGFALADGLADACSRCSR